LLLGCAGVLALASAPPAERGRPNVVVFLADDLGYGDLACHGNPHGRTPQLDAFAREAVALDRFYVSPVCSPTRASLMTGRDAFRTGVCDVFGAACEMDTAEITLAQRLRAAGYATGLFGKWHLGDEPARAPHLRGFDEALTFRGPALGAKQYFDPNLLHNGQPERRPGYCMDVFTDAALRFIRENRARNFFVYLPANLIHTPLVVAPELAESFAGYGLSDNTRRAFGMVQSLDTNFGRLRAALRELGLEDNTLLIFASDNGPCSGSVPLDRHMAGLHGLKGTVYENGIRVPAYMRWPAGFASPGRVRRLAAHVDVLPTVLEACGVAPPAGVKLDGLSLLPLLRNPTASWPDRAIAFQWDSGQAPRRGQAYTVLEERWKLVQPCGMDSPRQQHIRNRYAELCRRQGRGERSIDGPPRFELYDLLADPGETKDRAVDQPVRVDAMRRHYDRWFDDVAARWNLPIAPPPPPDRPPSR
jgi:arylsulfatase A-like enzyme